MFNCQPNGEVFLSFISSVIFLLMHSEVTSVLVEHTEHTYSVAGKKLHTNVPAPIYSERKVGKKIIKRTELSKVG